MTFSILALVSRNTKSVEDLSNGALQIRNAGGTVLVSMTLEEVAGTVDTETGAVTFAGMPKVVTGQAGGDAATARWLTEAGDLYKTVSSEFGSPAVGIPGSGAKIIIDNGVGTLAIGVGEEIEVIAASWVAA